MAHIKEEIITIKVSRIVREGAGPLITAISSELLANIESIVQELIGDPYVVEVSIEASK